MNAPIRPAWDRNADPKKLAKASRQVTRRLNANPYVQHVDVPGAQIYVFQNFLSAADCALLIGKIDADAVPSTLYKGTEQEGFRTSYSCHMSRHDADVMRIDAMISDLLDVENGHSETMQGQRYHVGQEFKPHHDFFHTDQDYWKKEGPLGGQRTWTAMIFLNLPEEGGQTEFPQLGIGVSPQAGMMLIWNNMTMDGTPNPNTLHAGTPVRRGVKYVVTKWFRQEDWVALVTPRAELTVAGHGGG